MGNTYCLVAWLACSVAELKRMLCTTWLWGCLLWILRLLGGGFGDRTFDATLRINELDWLKRKVCMRVFSGSISQVFP